MPITHHICNIDKTTLSHALIYLYWKAHIFLNKREKTENKKLSQLTRNTAKQVKGPLFHGDIDPL